MCLKKLVRIITFLALSAPGLEAFASRKNREFMVFYLLSRSLCVSTFFPCIRGSVGILSHAVIRFFSFFFLIQSKTEDCIINVLTFRERVSFIYICIFFYPSIYFLLLSFRAIDYTTFSLVLSKDRIQTDGNYRVT